MRRRYYNQRYEYPRNYNRHSKFQGLWNFLIFLVCAIITVLIIYAVVNFRQYLKLSANIFLLAIIIAIGIIIVCLIIWFISWIFSSISNFTTQMSINRLEVKKQKEEIKQKYPKAIEDKQIQKSYYKTADLPRQPKQPQENIPQEKTQTSNNTQQKKTIDPVYYSNIAEYLEPNSIFHGIRKDDTISIGTWEDNRTTLILGTSHSGKTKTMVLKAVNAIMSNSLIIVCDPHAAKERSLTKQLYPFKDFLYPGTIFAVEHNDIYNNIKILNNELSNRIAKKGTKVRIVIFIDEWNRLMRDEKLAKYLTNLIEVLGQESSGFNIYAVITCQQITGNVVLRKSVSSYIIHRVDETEAKLIVPARFSKYSSQLQTGISIVKDADGYIELLQQILVTKYDILAIIKQKAKQILYLKQLVIQSLPTNNNKQSSTLVRKIQPTEVEPNNTTFNIPQRRQRVTTDLREIPDRPTVKLNQKDINYKSYKQLNQTDRTVSNNSTWNNAVPQNYSNEPDRQYTPLSNSTSWYNEPTNPQLIPQEVEQIDFLINEPETTKRKYNIALPDDIVQLALEMAKAGISRRKIREATKLEGTKYKILKELLDSEGL